MMARTGRARPLAMAVVILFVLALTGADSVHADAADVRIQAWQIQWIDADRASENAPSPSAGWLPSGSSDPQVDLPDGAVGMWVRLSVPPTEQWTRPALFIDRLYEMQISVYEEGELIHEDSRTYRFERNKLLVPLNASSEEGVIDIKIISGLRSGIAGEVRIGEFGELSERFVRQETLDMALGIPIASIGLLMLVCSGFLIRRQRGSWISLCLVALSTGMLILSYNPLPYIYFEKIGPAMLFLFDIWMIVLFPALHYYVNSVFEGRYKLFTVYGRVFFGYSVFCFLILLAYKLIGESFFSVYELLTVPVLGAFILVQMMLILALSIRNALRGNVNSILLSAGFLLLALSAIADLVLYYTQETPYVFVLWKLGVAAMLIALIVILARQISENYTRVVSYSKKLELYHLKMQGTEKMKVVSDLAASVAHEVRNPMQVTRGFLQFLSRKSGKDNEDHFALAIQELDRAAGIINDFLAFAKPEPETVVPLDLTEELKRVESMMSPLAALNGGEIRLSAPDRLFIRGNSSKLAQALINIVKNSIEAIEGEGVIRIEARAEKGTAVVSIADDGVGMDESQLGKLGEAFYSTKPEGTGLGLMATCRIVELMKGRLEFRSAVGEGFEAILRFPLLEEEASPLPFPQAR
ncbi:sensor histidine kinase [Cohnella thailandensis]|uniref:histidine kinase n=1 Tax=Cohnella thailandensis TaxID=557557 RepID=A0A841SPE5_9BACL|nr:sensor histidine kinase [Cohnella thailandensis]MBB6634313.1 sensor histidine kinase [Cohnella thailandensis]MBP1972188.1 signal transduction histidine kinase [Cohnella thailandensis]